MKDLKQIDRRLRSQSSVTRMDTNDTAFKLYNSSNKNVSFLPVIPESENNKDMTRNNTD